MITLKLNEGYGPLIKLNAEKLGRFTIITGRNGAGKSSLLKGMTNRMDRTGANGTHSIDAIIDDSKWPFGTLYADHSTFQYARNPTEPQQGKAESSLDKNEFAARWESFWKEMPGRVRGYVQEMSNHLTGLEPLRVRTDEEKAQIERYKTARDTFLELSAEHQFLASFCTHKPDEISQELWDAMSPLVTDRNASPSRPARPHFYRAFASQSAGDSLVWARLMNNLDLIAENPRRIRGMSGTEAYFHLKERTFVHNPLSPTLIHVCQRYVTRRQQFILNKYDDVQSRKTCPDWDSEYERLQGKPPWDYFDSALSSVGLPYRLDAPEVGSSASGYCLTHLTTGKAVTLDCLSSGEQTLLAMAGWLVTQDRDNPHITARISTQLILLDEVDAYLHPEMIAKFLKLVEDVICQKHQIPVILVTHNLTTVALAKDAQIMTLECVDGEHHLRNVSRQSALNALCVGVPTLAIDPSGRRTVFCESENDATHLTKIYDYVKSSLESSRSLIFLGSGIKRKRRKQGSEAGSGEHGAGKSIVEKYAQKFGDSETKNIFGLRDWDLDDVDDPRNGTFILSNMTHCAIENLVLDPLVLIVAATQEPNILRGLGLDKGLRLSVIKSMRQAERQALINKLCQQFIYASDMQETVTVSYGGGGIQQSVPRAYLEMNGHELQDKLRDTFPCLASKIAKDGPEALKAFTIDLAFRNAEWAIPTAFHDTFKKILDHEPEA